MYSPSDSFQQSPDLKVRRMHEWEMLLVYTPRQPQLHMFNTEAWLIFELAQGRSYAEICAAVAAVAPGDVDAERVAEMVRRTLRFFEAKGIVERTAA